MDRKRITNRVVFHHSLSHDVSAFTIEKWHVERGFECIGYHYVIRADGGIELGRDIKMVGAHAFGRNKDSIGVCITGNFNNHKPTQEQYYSAAYLYLYLCGIYKKHLKLDFHRSGFESCPGFKFNKRELKKLVKEFSGKKPNTWWKNIVNSVKNALTNEWGNE